MEEIKPAATGSENATQEQGYLMAYDKKEQKAKGVKGIAANGELETLEANETNKDQFIRVDRHGNFFTNFGKNFMYQMANMAELEWAVISERYKDTAAYKIREGKAYTGRVPIGFKIEKIDGVKKVVHDNEEQTRAIFDYLLATKST